MTEAGASAGNLVRLATPADIADILDLQARNLVVHGGALSVAFPAAWFETVMREMPVVIARCGGLLAGYLVASTPAQTRGQPLVEAKFAAYPGSAGAYNAGPLCLAEAARGQGLALRLMAEQRRCLPGREAVAFARADNAASRATHARAGYRDVAGFERDGVAYVVLARPG